MLFCPSVREEVVYWDLLRVSALCAVYLLPGLGRVGRTSLCLERCSLVKSEVDFSFLE